MTTLSDYFNESLTNHGYTVREGTTMSCNDTLYIDNIQNKAASVIIHTPQTKKTYIERNGIQSTIDGALDDPNTIKSIFDEIIRVMALKRKTA